MDEPEPGTGRSLRLALVAFGLLGLLAVVAFASKSGLGKTTDAQPTPGYVNYAFSAFLIVFVLAIPVAAYTFLVQAREASVERKSFRSRVIQNLLTFLFFCFVAAVIIYIKLHHGHLLNLDTSALKKSHDALANKHGRRVLGKNDPKFEWLVLWIAVAAIGMGLAAAIVARRRRKRRTAVPLAGDSTVSEDLAASMSDAIDDLEAEPDARRAVIAAYARMEAVLARHGLRRRPSETPVEYLRRVLLGLTARADAVSRLTGLFEQAKFSRHEIDGAMKQDAIGALREIRDDLRGAVA
jgi:hypothetical protein